MMTTSSNLNLWLLGGIFVRYLSTKLPPNDVVKGRVVCNILFSTPLRILGECPSQSVQFSKNVLHHFGKPCVFKFTSRHYIISSGVYNSASSSDAMFGKKDVTYSLTYLLTHTIKFEDLTSVYYVTGRCSQTLWRKASFSKKTVL